MNENEKEILKNLVIGQSFKNFDDLIAYILNQNCQYNVNLLDILFKEMLKTLKTDEKNIIRYQVIFNAIILSFDRDKMYSKDSSKPSIYEIVRKLTYIFQDNIYKYLSGVLDIKVKIVEVNKRGLKIKHFAYDQGYEINELVYIGNLVPNNIYYVSDYYEVDIRNLIPYILHVSSKFVYHFDLGYEEIAKVSIEKMKEPRVCKIYEQEMHLCYIDFNFYTTMAVEYIYNNEVQIGLIEDEVYYYDPEEVKGEVIRPIIAIEKKVAKERRSLDESVAKYFLRDLDSFKAYLQDKGNFVQIFDELAYLKYAIGTDIKLNMLEKVNLYYRPVLNYILENHNLNYYYYDKDSLLNLFVTLERTRKNVLTFLIDKDYDYDINIVDINVNGRIKKCFAYEKKYKVGEPVFITFGPQYYIGFVHETRTIPFKELLGEIEYYEISDITSIMNLKTKIINESNIDKYYVFTYVKYKDKVIPAIIKNYVPYTGEVLKYKGNEYLVLEDPIPIAKEKIDLEEVFTIEM